VTNYDFEAVDADHTIEAVFSANLTPRGTPEWWLAAHGLTNGSFEAEEQKDHDGDGMLTWEEWVADTVPTNTESALVVTGISRAPTSVLVTWQGGTAAWQIVERATSVVARPPEWVGIHTDLPPTPVEGSYEDTEAGGLEPPRYYRIRVER